MPATNNNSSSTPYDDAFRTMMAKGGTLRLPFIAEMFHLQAPFATGTPVDSIRNEYFVEEGNGKQRKIITDSVLHINGRTYHIECQSTDDGTILVRMFEYDVSIGLEESQYSDYNLTVNIPTSGVLFLRKTAKTPMQMSVTINTRSGSISYPVDVTNLSDYSLDDLIKKNLLFLFPFYMFNLEDEFSSYETSASSREKVVDSMNNLLEHVNKMYEDRKLSMEHYLLITDMLKKVTDSLTQKYDSVRKELDNIMGGKILEFKGENLINAGKIDGLLDLVYDGLLAEDVAAEQAEKRYGVKKDDFKKMLASYTPEEVLMQG